MMSDLAATPGQTVGPFFHALLRPDDSRLVGDAHAHAHPADVTPATHLVGRFLGFEIEVNDVLHERTCALKGESVLGAISIRSALIFFWRGGWPGAATRTPHSWRS
jgi:hypothetical protein